MVQAGAACLAEVRWLTLHPLWLADVAVAGLWKGRPVAVKVISHSSADDMPISRELSLR
jgi:hypothetical protein